MIAYLPVIRLFRPRGAGSARVAFIELFFDLVFVFAVRQLAYHLIENLTVRGVVETIVMLVAIWWVWIYTAWVTNWMNPEKWPVRWMLLSLMLVGLVLSTAIPEAFDSRALQFALAYLVMQVGRTAFVALSYRRVGDPQAALNLTRITLWFVFSAPFWIAGALIGGDAQLLLWAVALGIELSAPAVRYWVPGFRASSITSWQVQGEHLAERAGLFMILALGEKIIVTGTVFSRNEITTSSVLALLATFVGTILFWLLYFSHGAEHGSRYISRSEQHSGRIARLTYTYLHMILIGGIVLLAVGDDIVLGNPNDPLDETARSIIIAASALYLLGNLLFKRSIGRPWLRSHLVGMIALTALWFLVPLIPGLTPLTLMWIVNGIVALVVIIDEVVWPLDEDDAAQEAADSVEI